MNRRALSIIFAGQLLALPLVGGCLSDAQQQRAEDSGSILSVFESKTPLDAAKDMANPYDADKRMRGLALIANAPFGGQEVYVKLYRDYVVNDSDQGVRGVAARALGLHGTPDDALLIEPLLKSPNRNTRLDAARALQRLHNPKVIGGLISASYGRTESDHEVRAECCTALGQYAEVRVLQTLIACVDDDHLVVNVAAVGSLRTLTGQEFGDDPRVWLAWLDKTKDPFAQREVYEYPIFYRDKDWYEYFPFVAPPPNEVAASPVGMPPLVTAPPPPPPPAPPPASN